MAKVITGKNDFATHFPDAASEWHPTLNGELTPSDVSYGSRTYNIWWICPNGHDPYQTIPNSRTARGTGCPVCAAKKRASNTSKPKEGNSLAEVYPEIAAEWHPTKNGELTPSGIAKASNKKVWWQCPNNPEHEYAATVGNRTRNGSGCPFCYRESIGKRGQ